MAAHGRMPAPRLSTCCCWIAACRVPAHCRFSSSALRDDAQGTLGRKHCRVATTAELAPGDRQPLLAAGFSEILLKPCGLADLQQVLALVQPDRHHVHVLDDQAALTSTGDASTMRALRLLLREELVQLERELEPLSRDRAGFDERLHRLRSSCGFCGAAALSTQTVWMQQQLSQHDATPAALARFRKTLLADTCRVAVDRPQAAAWASGEITF